MTRRRPLPRCVRVRALVGVAVESADNWYRLVDGLQTME